MFNALQRTTPYRFMVLPRLVAGLPLLFFGVKHVLDPDPFRAILIASGLPLVELNVIAAPLAECVAAALLLSGFLARLGGVLGVVTMLPAIYATLTLKGLDPAHLPAGLTQVPFVPPLPLPVVVLLSALAVLILGAGAWSVDAAVGTNGMATMPSAPLRSR
ncbi:MAG: DoxX family protein [Candidatus Limnocylindria bacterium]